MKKLIAILLLLTLVGCEAADTVSQIPSVESTVSVEGTSSADEASSDEKKEYTLLDFVSEDGYLDVKTARKKVKRPADAKSKTDDSYVFAETEGIIGYEINDRRFTVDAETLRRLVNVPCRGTGEIQWSEYEDVGSWGQFEQASYAPAHLINDPLYMSMILPSEATCYLSFRKNAGIMAPASEEWANVITIGAVYQNQDKKFPDDAEFTICISDVDLVLRTKNSDGWFMADEKKVPSIINGLYYLPWTLHDEIGTLHFPDNEQRITYYDDHVEVKIKGSEINGTDGKALHEEVDEAVLHFWGTKYYFDCPGDEILGMVNSFKIWIKEEEWAEYLVVGMGADWRRKDETGTQAYNGYKHAVTATPTVVVGHTVLPSEWDKVVGDESEKIQELIGLK